MNQLRGKAGGVRRCIAWLLMVALITGNMSQYTLAAANGADGTVFHTATGSNALKATPSAAVQLQATPSQAKKIIDVKVTGKSITRVLKKDVDDRPELKEELIPFKGEQKDLVMDKLNEELEGKTLIRQKKTGKAMYLVVVAQSLADDPFSETDWEDEEDTLNHVEVIGVNGYTDRECQFQLQITGEDLVVNQASVEEYAVVGETISPESDQEATPSQILQAAAYFDSSSLVSLGEARLLDGQEREALMGMDTKDSYELNVKSLGMTALISQISAEKNRTPYETALMYYGPEAEEKKEVVELRLTQSRTGTIKAGEFYHYTLTYTMQTAPLYEYASGGKLPLFDRYKDARIEFTVPEGVQLEEQEGKVKRISSQGGENVYEIHVGDEDSSILPGKLGSITLNAWIDGNGQRAAGEVFELSQESAVFYASISVADRTIPDQVIYSDDIKTVTTGEQPEDSLLSLVSDDAWFIEKKVVPNKNSYVVERDESGNPRYVTITYSIEVGMKGSFGDISRQPGGTIYQTYGRTGFEDGSFQITDHLSIVTKDAPEGMKPVSVTATWGDGSQIPVEEKEDGSITIKDYKTQGQNGVGNIYVSEQAPTYSSYYVTAKYPYEPFLLNYNDARVSDASVFTVKNKAHLEYRILGTDSLRTDDSEADVSVHEVNKPAVIRIRKQIDEGVGAPKDYNRAMEKEYPGLAEFLIYSLDEEGKETPYTNYTVLNNGKENKSGTAIAVNPSAEPGEEAYGTTGDKGYVEIQADPGIYVIREGKKPVGTEYSGEKDIQLTIKAGEKKEITVVNAVIGKGSVEFYKKALTWESGPEPYGLKGAEFTLYEKKEDGSLIEVKTVTSGDKGLVQFKPVTPGQYVVREKSANGYILDLNDYPVMVEAGKTSQVKPGDNVLVNTLNQGSVHVKKWLQSDSGTYIPIPEAYRNNFNNRFWFEKSTDGTDWKRVDTNRGSTFSLGQDSGFETILPAFTSDNKAILYRLVEELPEGFQDGNAQEDGFYTKVVEGKTYLYKEFQLTPLKETKLDVKNDKQGTLILQKESWSPENGWLNKNGTKNGLQFQLYSSDENGGDIRAEAGGEVLTTDWSGQIHANKLDVNRQYYWHEVDHSSYLEAENPEKVTSLVVDGTSLPVIGPFKVSRQQDTLIKAYNITQKVPYWLYKYDIVDEYSSISAKFQIKKSGDPGEGITVDVSRYNGTMVLLDPGTVYEVKEIQAPENYVMSEPFEITTPEGPVTRAMMEEWYDKGKRLETKIYNRPYKEVNIKKIQYQADTTLLRDVHIPYEVYQDGAQGLERVEINTDNHVLMSNQYDFLAPGEYYFKEVVPEGNINPLFLLPDQRDGKYDGYRILNSQVYYGPFTVTAAENQNNKKMDVTIDGKGTPFENYQNSGRVKVIKKDALRGTFVKDAVLGIFREADFNPEDWQSSIQNPIQEKSTEWNGEVVFDSPDLKIFNPDGSRIKYVIAEIQPPSGYLQSYEVLSTTLKEGVITETVNGEAGAKALVIENEPKLTLRTQKYWVDGWSDQFYKNHRILGNVKLALYKVNPQNPQIADYVTTEITSPFDGMASFTDINRNDIYYVAEVQVPSREETGLSFDLNMGEKIPLPLEQGNPVSVISVQDLETRYNAVKYTGTDLSHTPDSLVQKTDPIYNYRSWVQFHIKKICTGVYADGTKHQPEPVNGARFTLYKMLEDRKDLSSIELEDLKDTARFEPVGQYESGTRINPETGVRADGEFDTAILEAGKVYWLVEEKPAEGYILPEGPVICVVFVPENQGYTGKEGIQHPYINGRDKKIVEIKNIHGKGSDGLSRYHFQIALNKWLKEEGAQNNLTLLGGVRFRIWLLNPVTKEKLFAVDEVETGLESDSNHKTGYGITRIIRFQELEEQIKANGWNPEDILDIDLAKNQVKATFALEEIKTPSKVNLNPELHELSVTVPMDTDYIDDQYFWKEGKDANYRLINTLSKEYPVKLVKYGYEPDSSTFGKSDDILDGMNIERTPLNDVKFGLWRYIWTEEGYIYDYIDTYTTNSDGSIRIPGGLPSGRYRIKEQLTPEQQKYYMTLYSGKDECFRYFTVENSPLTVSVYNPKKPGLEIEKTTWRGKGNKEFEGIIFSVRDENGQVRTAEVKKQKDGRYVAVLNGLDSGRYTIVKEELDQKASSVVTDQYFEQSTVLVGYQPEVEQERVTLKPLDSSVTQRVVSHTVKNPRLTDLIIYKTDGETHKTNEGLKGALFQLDYRPFRTDLDFTEGRLNQVKAPDYEKPDQGFTKISESLSDQGNGSYLLKNCVPGWYRITETKAPEGYTRDSSPVIVAVTGEMGEDEKQAEISIENRKKAELTVTKVLNFGDGFKDDSDLEERLPSEIMFGVYTRLDGSYSQVLGEDGKPVQIKINQFTKEDGFYSGSNQVLLPQNPPGGRYYLKETEHEDWAVSAQDPVDKGELLADGFIDIGEVRSGIPIGIKVNNVYAKAKVRITKVDAADQDKKLTGASFDLFADPEFHNRVASFEEIHKSGVYKAVFSTKLYPEGTYYVKEQLAPAGYRREEAPLPEGGLVVQTGKTTEVTLNNQSGVDFWITKYSGAGEQKTPKSGIAFELYHQSVSGEWNYVSQEVTDEHGTISFLGLLLQPGESYGVSEVVERQQGFPLYEMTEFEGEKGPLSSITADGKKIYVLTDETTVSPGVYRFQAHNQEAVPLTLLKYDWSRQETPDPSIKVLMKVTDQKTGNQVGEPVEVPYGETQTSIYLLPGTYKIEEMEVSDNSQGYIINRDDIRTTYEKEVTIEKGKVPAPVDFTNIRQKTEVALEKTSPVKSIKDVWWNDNQEVTYTLTPHVTNTIPLDGFTIRDTGITMLDEGKNVLPEADYSDEAYSITSVEPGASTQKNWIRDGKTGTIMADVIFYDFDGNQAGRVHTVKVSGDNPIPSVKPEGNKPVQSFEIRYRDDSLKASTKESYILGQDFTPGKVGVTVKLKKQDAKLENGSYKEEIRYIRNNAEVLETYRKWDRTGTLSQKAETLKAEAFADILVVQSQAPVISAQKHVTPVKKVQPGDTLKYTLTVKNETKSQDPSIVPMKDPVMIDELPDGITVSGISQGENRILKAVRIISGPKDMELVKTIKRVDPLTGRETLFLLLNGELKRNEEVTVEVEAQVGGNIVSYGKNILNKLFVTSNVLQPPFALNKTGASFMIETKTGNQWPSPDLPSEVVLPDEIYRNYGYVSDSAENYMETDNGLLLYKEVKGNLDTRYVSGTTVGRVAKTAGGEQDPQRDGSVQYRLTISNDSTTNYITKLQLMDILPAKRDLNADGNHRLSDYPISFDQIESMTIEHISSEETERKREDFAYKISYSSQNFDRIDAVKAAKAGVLNDNSNGFWTDSSEDATAFRIQITDPGFHLAPGENLVITYKANVSYTTAEELDEAAYGYAVNDFAVTYSYQEGMSGVEIPTGQLQNSNCPQVLLVPEEAAVSGRFFIDEDNSGIQKGNPAEDHFLTNLRPVLESGYFHAGLLKYGKDGAEEVTGAIDNRGRFTFQGLTPAKPFGIAGNNFTKEQEDRWYQGSSLDVTKLKGEHPAHYQIFVNTKNMPKGYEDLVLKLAKPYQTAAGENETPGRSRLPQTLKPGGINYEESLDSNFMEKKNGYFSEDFFLWSTSGDYDTTKDIGFVPYRSVTVKKTDQEHNPVEGVHFTIYGPFTNEEIETLKTSPVTDPSVLSSPAAAGTTVIKNGEALWEAGELLYYRNYIIAEDGAPAGYEMEQAGSSDMEPMDSYEVKGQKAWILKSKEFQAAADPVSSTVTVVNNYGTGSLSFDKVDQDTGKILSSARFSLTKEKAELDNAFLSFMSDLRNKSEQELRTMGITDLKLSETSVEFELVTGHVEIPGIPYGTYQLKEEKAPDGYLSLNGSREYFFTLSENQKTAVLGNNNVIENQRAEFEIRLQKSDNLGRSIEGMQFQILGPGKYDSTGFLSAFGIERFQKEVDSGRGVFSTDHNGLIRLGLKHGDYEIREVPNDQYDPIEPFYIRVKQNGTLEILKAPEQLVQISARQPDTLIVTNQISTGTLELEKVDSENKTLRLDGAEFTLTNLTTLVPGAWEQYRAEVAGLGASWNEQQVKGDTITFVLHEKGIIENLPFGTYRLTEIKAPGGYILGTDPWTREFTIEKGHKEVRYTNSRLFEKTEGAIENKPSTLTLIKTNAVYADQRLKGAEFILKASDGRYVRFERGSFAGYTAEEGAATTLVTGEDGQILLKRIPKDTYTFIETKAPAGYSINTNIPPLTLDGIHAFVITIQDERLPGGGGGGGGGSSDGPSPDNPLVTIIPDPVPLSDLPGSMPEDLIVIEDGAVPLAGLPKTGENRKNAGEVFIALSGLLAILSGILMKKKRKYE